MRLTKRQLKRIIREEYSRLKRRGLIREAGEMEHEQDDFLAEQLHQYEDQLVRAAQQCVAQGMMDQEDGMEDTPESHAANAIAFFGQDNSGPESAIAVLNKCNKFSLVLHHMKEEQKAQFGASAPRHEVISMIVDLGIWDEILMAGQAEIGG